MTKNQRIICLLMLLLTLYFTGLVWYQNKAQCEYSGKEAELTPTSLVVALDERYEVIFESKEQLIERLAIENNFDVNTAKVIAHCESHYGKYNFNKNSSAKGIYQFTDRTWKYYCKGDVLDDYDNINCFIKLYNKNKNWWSCRY